MRLLKRIDRIEERLERAAENGNEAKVAWLEARLERLEARAEERGLELNDVDWTPPELVPSNEGLELNDIDWTPPKTVPSDEGLELNDIDWTPPEMVPTEDTPIYGIMPAPVGSTITFTDEIFRDLPETGANGRELNDVDWTLPEMVPSDDGADADMFVFGDLPALPQIPAERDDTLVKSGHNIARIPNAEDVPLLEDPSGLEEDGSASLDLWV